VYQSENADVAAGLEVGPERQEEAATGIQGHAADNVARAAPKKMASKALASMNRTSKKGRHRLSSRWLRNSMAMPRTMSSQRTIMSGKVEPEKLEA